MPDKSEILTVVFTSSFTLVGYGIAHLQKMWERRNQKQDLSDNSKLELQKAYIADSQKVAEMMMSWHRELKLAAEATTAEIAALKKGNADLEENAASYREEIADLREKSYNLKNQIFEERTKSNARLLEYELDKRKLSIEVEDKIREVDRLNVLVERSAARVIEIEKVNKGLRQENEAYKMVLDKYRIKYGNTLERE